MDLSQVCNTVYEEVCEAAQPTYGGAGGAGGASGGYGAAKAPACRQVSLSFLHNLCGKKGRVPSVNLRGQMLRRIWSIKGLHFKYSIAVSLPFHKK